MRMLYRASQFVVVILAIAILAACSSGNKGNESSASNNGKENTGAVNTAAASPTKSDKQVTIRVMDWSDSVKDLHEKFDKMFMEKYPNIKIEYTQLTIDQYKNTILAAVASGESPDLFPVPVGMKLSSLVNDKWFQPLDPYIDQSFKDLFMDGTFQNGTTMVDDKIYAIPESMAAAMPSTLLFYNKKLFREAGLDPENPPKTYSEFREAAKKITEAGKGKYYGMIEGGKQNNRWLETVRTWASLGGGDGLNSNSPINLATGSPAYDTQGVKDIFSLFLGIGEDGSFHPKTMGISAPEARALFGQGQAGFIVQGSWCIGVWNKENPDLEYGVMAPPVPDSGRKGSLPFLNLQAWIGLSAYSEHPEEAVLYLKEYYGGDFFQAERVRIGDTFSVVKGINEANLEIEQLKQYYELAKEYGHVVPDPAVNNPDTFKVLAEYKDVNPNIGDLLGGTVAGSFKNYQERLAAYSQQVEKSWNAAIAAATGKGASVKASDFLFPNWDPMKDYTAADYQALK